MQDMLHALVLDLRNIAAFSAVHYGQQVGQPSRCYDTDLGGASQVRKFSGSLGIQRATEL